MQFLSVLTCSTLYNMETGRWQWPIKAKSLQSRLISQWYYTHKNKRGRNTDEYTGWLRQTSKENRFELGIELWGVSQVCGRGKEERNHRATPFWFEYRKNKMRHEKGLSRS